MVRCRPIFMRDGKQERNKLSKMSKRETRPAPKPKLQKIFEDYPDCHIEIEGRNVRVTIEPPENCPYWSSADLRDNWHDENHLYYGDGTYALHEVIFAMANMLNLKAKIEQVMICLYAKES